jgi:hypothetical protein
MEMEEVSPSSVSFFGRLLYSSGLNCSKDSGGEIGDHFPIAFRMITIPHFGDFFVEKNRHQHPLKPVFWIRASNQNTYMKVTYIWSRHLLYQGSDKNGGVMLFIVFIILIAGFLLYVLLKSPVDINEEPAVMELRQELKLSSLNLPEYSKNKAHSSLQAEEE